ncbi:MULTISPECIES: hypothetical protein [unclassified Novosphingobium]|uniref:hypothetical protein n=1 Tax=unclassified Novosphingobium TaxID=2644732 RepID=UPI001ACA7BF6|nr:MULTISPECIES: hypothetical protein [unclassified Novosphingobium]MBN9144651.1 hypothetical protein [Novosphingobium sp.]MDR6708305.1 hypothetical protein [Novosphingobium sp. 1748]
MTTMTASWAEVFLLFCGLREGGFARHHLNQCNASQQQWLLRKVSHAFSSHFY